MFSGSAAWIYIVTRNWLAFAAPPALIATPRGAPTAVATLPVLPSRAVTTDASLVKTLAEAYDLRHPSGRSAFHRACFCATLHRRAWPLVPFLSLAGYFDVDHELVAECGRAHSLHEIEECLADYACHPHNSGWLRNWFRIRISTRRLRRFARHYLADPQSAGQSPRSGTNRRGLKPPRLDRTSAQSAR